MNGKSRIRWFFGFILIITLLAGCAEQTPAAPTAVPTTPATATPTPVPYVDVTKSIKVDGAQLWFIQATDDTSLYDAGPFAVQHADDVTVLHVDAEIISGNLDLETFQDGIALFDENGEDLAMVSYSVEKPFWEFLVPLSSKSFILQLPDGQMVKLDPILNLLAGGASGAAAQPTAANTSIPPTPEPSILIQLGPGKFGKAMWLDVLKGDYQIVGGSTLLTGSSIGVNEDWMNFPPGLAIDVVGTTVTLKGTAYPDGSKLRVDSSGNLVLRDGADPAADAAAAEPQNAPLQSYNIPAGVFPMDDMGSCDTDISISAITATGFTVNGSTISMRNGNWVLWCPGAKHAWVGKLSYKGYTFESDADSLLQFMVNTDGGYEYIGGKGTVTQPDGQVIDLSGAAASSNDSGGKFSEVLVSDSFDDNSSEWPLGKVDTVYWKGSRSIENGVLDWEGVSRSPLNWYITPDTAVVPDNQSDQLTSVNVKLVDPSMEGAYGLVVRLKELKEGSRFYAFVLDPTGYITFFLSSKDGWTPLLDWQETPGLNPDGWNKLSVEALGSHFRLFLNDNLVGEVDDDTLKAGLSGLMIETYKSSVSFDVQFDNFEVQLPSADTSNAPVLNEWNGIPLPLGATNGQEVMGDYQFTTRSASEDIKAYYRKEIAAQGWQIRENLMASIPTDLAFEKAGTFAFFKINPDGAGNTVMIHMQKQ